MKTPSKIAAHDFFSLFKYSGFVKLWVAQVCGQVALNMLHFVLIIQVFQKTGNNFLVGILIAAMSLPSIFLAPLAGVVADSFSRRKILISINLSRFIVVVMVIFALKLPVVLLLLAVAATAVSQFYTPTEQSSIPDVVPREALVQANTVFTFSLYVSLLVGYTVAGPLYEYVGAFITFIVIGGLFFIALALNQFLPKLDQHVKHKQETVRERLQLSRVKMHIKEAFQYITHERRILLVIILQVAFIFSVERAVIALVPALAQELFGISVAEISFFLITPLALGTILGAAFVNKYKHKYSLIRIIRFGLVIDAVTLLLLPLFHDLSSLVHVTTGFVVGDGAIMRIYLGAIAFTSGLADVLIVVSAQTYIQQNVSSERRGRVVASMMMMMNLFGVPLVLLITLLADIISITTVLIIFGVATWVVVFWGRQWFKKLEQQERTSNQQNIG